MTTGSRPSRKAKLDELRSSGQVACAECRRLKIKCDRQIPCQSCIKRSCPSICPLGTLSLNQDNRFIIASTSDLHGKVLQMGSRIETLEAAISEFQAKVSSEEHPLLRQELLKVKLAPDVAGPRSSTPPPPPPAQLAEALGTLTINENGVSKYFGRSAGTESLFLAGAELDDYQATEQFRRSNNIYRQVPSRHEPGYAVKSMDLLYSILPNRERALLLFNLYHNYGSWAFHPVPHEQVMDELIPLIYKYYEGEPSSSKPVCHEERARAVTSAQVAVLLGMFALGALLDPSLPAFSNDSEDYYHVARVALSMGHVFEAVDIETVQAISLLALYNGNSPRYTLDETWSLIAFAAKLSHGMGMHRDFSQSCKARGYSNPVFAQRRRRLFWELFCMEIFYSMSLGRPASIHLSYLDCRFPDEEAEYLAETDTQMAYDHFKYEFTKEIFSSVLEISESAQMPDYATILDLDRKVREKTAPPYMKLCQAFMYRQLSDMTDDNYMKGKVLVLLRSITFLYIHRSFFATAMLQHPLNPLQSPYAPSFLASFRAASSIIAINLTLQEVQPKTHLRSWSSWSHLFSAALIMGCIPLRAPASSMAPLAFKEFAMAMSIFETGAAKVHRARHGLYVLRRVWERAKEVYVSFKTAKIIPNPKCMLNEKDIGFAAPELQVFAGHTKVLNVKSPAENRKRVAEISSQIPPSSASSSAATVSSPNLSTPPTRDSPGVAVESYSDTKIEANSYGKSMPTDSTFCPSSDEEMQVHPTLLDFLSHKDPEMQLDPDLVSAMNLQSIPVESMPSGLASNVDAAFTLPSGPLPPADNRYAVKTDGYGFLDFPSTAPYEPSTFNTNSFGNGSSLNNDFTSYHNFDLMGQSSEILPNSSQGLDKPWNEFKAGVFQGL